MGELKEVVIRLSSNPKFVHVIDIVVVDILESYAMILNRDWSLKLNGYFAIEQSHFLFPRRENSIWMRINNEKH